MQFHFGEAIDMSGSAMCVLIAATAQAVAAGAEPVPVLEEKVRAGSATISRLSGRPAAEVVRTIAERAAALEELIGRNAGRALALALPEESLARLRRAFPEAASRLEERGAWTGAVTVVIEDDLANQASRRLLSVRSGNSNLEVHFAAEPRRNLRTGETVRIEGLRVGGKIAATASAVVADAPAEAACSPIGEQKIAVLAVSFPRVENPYITLDVLHDAVFGHLGGNGKSLDDYWRKASYGKTWATGDVFGWLPVDRVYTCNETHELRDAAVLAASKRADMSGYNRFFIYFPGSCGWSGMSTEGCSAGKSAAWFDLAPKTSYQQNTQYLTFLAAHEGGHNLGSPEVLGRDYGTEPLGAPDNPGQRLVYADPFTAQGGSINMLGHYNVLEKLLLGWLDPSQVIIAETPGEYRITPLSAEGGIKGLVVRRPGTDGVFWLEYRQPTDPYEATLPQQTFNGALVHYEDAQNAPHDQLVRESDLLDFTASSNANDYADFVDAALAQGQRWSDVWSPAGIEVTSANSDGLTVRIGNESCAWLGATQRRHGSGEETGDVPVFAPGDCQWSVRTSQPWVTLLSADSGVGNGTVSYRLAASDAEGDRRATIGIGRQPFAITQSGTRALPRGEGMFPETGAGYGQTFTFHFSHPAGAERIQQADVRFQDESRDCTARMSLQAFPGMVPVSLMTGGASGGGAVLGEDSALENSVCALDLKASSFVRRGPDLYVRLALRFKPGFEGIKQVILWPIEIASRQLYTAGQYLAGTWYVGARPGEIPAIRAVVNAASFEPNRPVAPGEMVTIYGSGLGPAGIALAHYDALGYLENYAGGTRVLFDGVQAPLVHTLGSQATAVAPYGVSGKTRVVVEYEGRRSNEFEVDVAAAAPGIFRMGAGTQAVVVNPDGGLNSSERPAARGREIAFYVTGEGQTNPAGVDGKLPEAQNWPAPARDVQVSFGGAPGAVTFRGVLWPGVMQVNARIPEGAPTGGAVPLTVSVGGIESPAGAKVAVQ